MSDFVFPSLPGMKFVPQGRQWDTTIYSSGTGKEQRVSRRSSKITRYDVECECLRDDVAAPSPWHAYSEHGILLYFNDYHLGAGASFYITEPNDDRRNFFAYSEPLLANFDTKSAGITQGSLTDGGLSNGAAFPAAAQLDYAYESITGTTGASYVVSAFVKMTDLSVPVPAANDTSGDFTLVSDGAASTYANITVTSLGGNLYRVSSSRTATTGGARNFGVLRAAAQSGKGFTVSGLQTDVSSAAPTPYLKTAGTPFYGTVRVRFEEDSLVIRKTAEHFYEASWSFISVL